MIKLFEDIELKINNRFHPEQLQLVDNSHLHTKLKTLDTAKFHLKLIIKSDELKKMNKIDAHKAIFSVLKEEIKHKIHALEIQIK